MIARLGRFPFIRLLSSLSLTLAALGLCALLVIAGTLFQAQHGLYLAQSRIFGAWVFLAGGWLPLPGMLLAGTLLFVNLLFASLFRLRYSWPRAGLILVHYGLLLLLAGAFLTQQYAQESLLTLREGQSSNLSLATHEWELAAWKEQASGRQVRAVDGAVLRSGQDVSFSPFPLQLRVQAYWPNCLPVRDAAGRISGFQERPLDPEPSRNIPGCQFSLVSPEGPTQVFSLFGASQEPQELRIDGETFWLNLQLKRLPLPATLQLIHFKKILYPGSDIAKSYSSLIEVQQQDRTRQELIAMNRPLRLGDTTFFQSSYSENPDGSVSSTLTVVKNPARLFPYVASLMIFLGLSWHFSLGLVRRSERKQERR